ncbi:S8 family peptidase [Tenggerimyces flavus]|uniref:S8 family serine peptidase n=1 Tax=Tenggerimyces flavus TaxID=1708749 RepID=A0ABV7YRX7_9ACTN|nr:S8 family serine peptidase [Tenggerimyces flavus]MBM7786410.1 subtilisin family serine protease [Tenggerimyces flavus]
MSELAAGIRPAPAITLLTGDQVQLGVDAKRRLEVTGVKVADRPDGRPVAIHTLQQGGDLYVYPSDALPLVTANRVDADLFNVSYLAEAGYTDAETKQLPIIVQYENAKANRANALPSSTVERTLESVDATAIDVTKTGAAALWETITTPMQRTLDAGVTRVWLNRRVTVDLDVSVPKIGAPAAWQAGFDGTGTTVAVLDTGIDDNHPDLAGHVLEVKSFLPDGDTTDGNGHGTHVASTIAGSGAASEGKYKGVAPGAKLLAGKVLADDGRGSISGVIAGMQWAAESGADVVNLSLGGRATNPSDIATEAVDELTEQYGTLFVIAAGNSGPDPLSIGSPGTADSALTVAATDKLDQLAEFSSRGPRVGDFGLKPDIAAPGVNITAAAAGGTGYKSLSGTSMATPHVVGAAAILAQRHPTWQAKQLKDALVSSSVDTGFSPFEQGAGRVDVARAVRQAVFSDGNLDFGRVVADSPPAQKTITYTNDGDAPVNLTLTPTVKTFGGQPAPAALVTIDRTTVTVPAGGTAQVNVSVDATKSDIGGMFRGTVKAAGGDAALTTAFAAYVEPEVFDLALTAVAPDGATDFVVDGWLLARNEGSTDFADPTRTLPGVPTVSTALAKGTYTVAASMSWRDGAGELQAAIVLNSSVPVSGAAAMTFDLRQARRITIETDRPAETYDAWFGFERASSGGDWELTGKLESADGTDNFWTLPVAPVTTGTFGYASQHILGEPLVRASTKGASPLVLHPRYRSADHTVAKLTGTSDYRLVYDGTGATATKAATATVALLTPTDICQPVCGADLVPRIKRLADAGVKAVLVAGSTGRVQLGTQAYALPTMTLPAKQAQALRDRLLAGPVELTIQGARDLPYLYLLRFGKSGELPADLDHRVKDDQLTAVENLVHADVPTATSIDWAVNTDGPTLATVETPTFVAPRPLVTLVGPVDPAASHRFIAEQPTRRPSVEFGYHALTTAKPRSIHWFQPPVVPGPPIVEPAVDGSGETLLCSLCREDNRFYQFMYLTTPEPAHQTGHLGLGHEQFPLTCDDPSSPPDVPTYSCERHLYDDQGKELTPYVYPELVISFSDGKLEVSR